MTDVMAVKVVGKPNRKAELRRIIMDTLLTRRWRVQPLRPRSPGFLAGLVFVLLSGTPFASKGDTVPSPACWVEFTTSPSLEVLARSKVTFPSFSNFDRYAVVTDPSVPDYREGLTVDKRLFFLFLASCERSKKAISVLVGDNLKRKYPPKIATMTIRPPTPDDLRRIDFYSAKPKYWVKECLVAVDIIDPPRKIIPREKDMLSFLWQHSRTAGRSLSVPSAERLYDHQLPRIYLQFSHSCERRLEFAKQLIVAYKAFYDDGGRYKILEFDEKQGRLAGVSGGQKWLDYYFPDDPRSLHVWYLGRYR